MSTSRFDQFFQNKNEEFLLSNGLVEMDESEQEAEHMAMSASLPLSLLWKNKDDGEKYVLWDSEMEKHLQHLGRLIDHGGRESFEGFSIYQEMGLNWVDGFATSQGAVGTCLPGNTQVMLLNGAIPIKDIVGQTVDLLSVDTHKDNPCIRKGYVYKTGNKEIVEITISLRAGRLQETTQRKSRAKIRRNSDVVFRLSSDHKIMAKSGEMIPAGQLKRGMRVCTHSVAIRQDGYAVISYSHHFGKKIEHRIHGLINDVAEYEVHHRNGNKLDNRSENLEVLTPQEHRERHGYDHPTSLRNPEMHKKTIASRNEKRKSELLQLFWELSTEAQSDILEDIFTVYHKRHAMEGTQNKGKWRVSADNAGNRAVRYLKQRINKHFGSLEQWSHAASTLNGTVIDVKNIGYEDCYDIEVFVSEPDDSRPFTNHNFLICSEGADRYSAKILVVKNCCNFGHIHATRITSLTHAKLHGGIKPVELNSIIAYSLGRGSGKISFGSGLNLQPMSKWAAKVGNHLTSDIGRYDTRGSNATSANQQRFAANALRHQTIPCYLPDLSFNTFYELARAGCACNIGSTSWPSGSRIDSNGMSVGEGKSNGSHATMCGGFAIEINGVKYIYWQNSHGARFKQGTRIRQNPFGCFMTKTNWNLLQLNKKFGCPYIPFTELAIRS